MKNLPTPKNKFKIESNIYFHNTEDLLEKFKKITEKISEGCLNLQSDSFNFEVLYIQEPVCIHDNYLYNQEPIFRIEKIDGNECIIFQSKMNFNNENF